MALFLSSWDYFNNSDSMKMKEGIVDQLLTTCWNKYRGDKINPQLNCANYMRETVEDIFAAE